jgi:hypothetical protein
MLHVTRALTSTRPPENRSRGVVEPRMSLFPWFASSAPLAIGISSGGMAAVLSIAVGIAAPCLAAVATCRPRYSYATPLCFTLLFVAAVGVLRFNSAAFVIDAWTTLFMTVTTIPRSRSTVARAVAATDAFADEV